MTAHDAILNSLHRAVQVVRSRTSPAETPNPAVAHDLFDQAKAVYDLLPEEVQRVCYLRSVVRVA